MTISYVIDVYRREIQPTTHLLDFALFVAYFPHLVAGPILRASLLLPQIERPRTITRRADAQRRRGSSRWGCFQKMFVADNLAPLVDTVFGPSATPAGADVLVAAWAFAFQIYGDFAGYSNIARGVSRLMGIELNVNFLFPYFVMSPQAFWRHWHISLSTWLRDYLYIPLGGNRGGAWKTNRNLMITMALGGLWHGAAWTFVLWGLYQGAVLVAARAISRMERCAPACGSARDCRRRAIALGVLMFQVTCFGWLIFRAESFGQLARFARLLFDGLSSHDGDSSTRCSFRSCMVVVPLLVGARVSGSARNPKKRRCSCRSSRATRSYGAVFWCVLLWGDRSRARSSSISSSRQQATAPVARPFDRFAILKA